jgi:hypothetical protein
LSLVPYPCSQCGEMADKRGRAKGMCHRCYHRQARKDWTERNRERERLKAAEYHQKHRARINGRITERRRTMRAEIMERLGGKCQCCGETEPVFLTIDHVQGDGAQVRKLRRHLVHKMILDEGCPPDRYQILCWNCNSAKHLLGVCPHV